MRKCDAMTKKSNACKNNGCFDRIIDGKKYHVCSTHKEGEFRPVRPGTDVSQLQIIETLDPNSSVREQMAEVYRRAGAVNVKDIRDELTIEDNPITLGYLDNEPYNPNHDVEVQAVVTYKEGDPVINEIPYINQDPTDYKEDREMKNAMTLFVIAGTGTRSIWGDMETMRALYTKLVTMIKGAIDKHGKVIVISGGAKGFDFVLAKAAIEAGAELHIYLPSPTYLDYYWGTEGKERNWINKIVESADFVKTVCDNHLYGKANFRRNEAMIDACDKLWAYPDPANTTGKGGTYSAMNYAKRTNVAMYQVTI